MSGDGVTTIWGCASSTPAGIPTSTGISAVPNMVALRALNPITMALQNSLAGYYTPGDNAPNEYVYYSTNTNGDDGGIFVIPDANLRTVTGEVIAQGDGVTTKFTGTFQHCGLLPGSVTIVANVTIHDNRMGVLYDGAPTMSDPNNINTAGFGTIDIDTTGWAFEFAAAPPAGPITASYTYGTPGRHVLRNTGDFYPQQTGAKGDYLPLYGPTDPNVVNGTDDTVAVYWAWKRTSVFGATRINKNHRIQPQCPGTHALVLDRDNISIIGVGKQVCGLHSLGYTGVSPETHYQIISGNVFRGFGVCVLTGDTAPTSADNIEFSNIWVNGNTNVDDQAGTSPANPVNGKGWDVTHRAICWNLKTGAQYFDKGSVHDCKLTGFKGEILQAASSNGGTFDTYNNIYANSNADGENIGVKNLFSRFNVYNNVAFPIETAVPPGSISRYEDHIITDTVIGGAVFIRQAAGLNNAPSTVSMKRCTLKNIPHTGINAAVENIEIEDNTLIDVGDAGTYESLQIDATVGSAHNISNTSVQRNKIISDNKSLVAGLKIVIGPNLIKNTTIQDNQMIRTDESIAAGNTIGSWIGGTDLQAFTPLPNNVYVRRNSGDTVFNYSNNMVAQEVIPPSTSFLVVAKYFPFLRKMYRVSGSFRVFVDTNVLLAVAWPDDTPGNHVENVFNGPFVAGDTKYFSITFCSTPSGGNPIQVVPTTSAANSIAVSCVIEDL